MRAAGGYKNFPYNEEPGARNFHMRHPKNKGYILLQHMDLGGLGDGICCPGCRCPLEAPALAARCGFGRCRHEEKEDQSAANPGQRDEVQFPGFCLPFLPPTRGYGVDLLNC